jgi:hypothetical protein
MQLLQRDPDSGGVEEDGSSYLVGASHLSLGIEASLSIIEGEIKDTVTIQDRHTSKIFG